jgi:predicted lipase
MKACLLAVDAVSHNITRCRATVSSLIESDFEFMDHEDVQCVIFKSHHNTIIIAIRGNKILPLDQLKVDCMVSKQYLNDGGGYVHSGFLASLNTIYSFVYDWMCKHHRRGAKVFVTGHSIGGALATICGARLSHANLHPLIYTFGAPRVGDTTFAERFENIHLFRFENANDRIPSLPSTHFGYVQCGEMWYITGQGDLACSSTPWKRFVGNLQGKIYSVLDGRVFDILQDHSLCEYKRRLLPYHT